MSVLDPIISVALSQELQPAEFRGIVTTFEADVRRLTEAMADAARCGDQAALRGAAHGLSGAAASVGALALERVARLALASPPDPVGLAARIRDEGRQAVAALVALARDC